MKEKPMKATLEEQRNAALKHYEEASNAIHCWSSFVENAIKHYNPEAVEVTYHNGTEVDVTVKERKMSRNLNELIRYINKNYYKKLPRFTIDGMNQAEFLIHIITASFNAGRRFEGDK